ncbi:MAG: hypothetical protein K9I71_08475 [Ignavibacteriales bacterium]|nr:hypothetical protein [Ignavibacteriales bacterium]MCF8316146.1 hypothetical protein [Ignavibacteriales bacterium]MCF8436648.1 hypothetical protein [Ignavibacteriales bacterium]
MNGKPASTTILSGTKIRSIGYNPTYIKTLQNGLMTNFLIHDKMLDSVIILKDIEPCQCTLADGVHYADNLKLNLSAIPEISNELNNPPHNRGLELIQVRNNTVGLPVFSHIPDHYKAIVTANRWSIPFTGGTTSVRKLL